MHEHTCTCICAYQGTYPDAYGEALGAGAGGDPTRKYGVHLKERQGCCNWGLCGLQAMEVGGSTTRMVPRNWD